ncbi:MAG TPA: DMT family transporter [Solirubrobacteraceae bacterium]|jgi:drug/metabolite transporter (DMT)-like permease|nr:DMT family transporter [Solirubrobacteraceae bacterium]
MSAVAEIETDVSHDRERAQIVAALALTLLMWASAFVVIRTVGRHLSPGPLALTRIVIGSLALGLAMLLRRQRVPSGAALARAAVAGVLWFGAYMLSLNAAERWVDAGTSSLLVNTGPLIIAVLAGWLLHEGFSRALLGGCAVALVGAGLIALSVSGHGSHELLGAALCIVAAFSYALAMVVQKPALRVSGALPITWAACTTGALVLLEFVPQSAHELSHASLGTLFGVLYLGIGPTATAFLLWAFVLSKMDAGPLGATTYVVPPLVVVISWIWLGQVPPVLAIPGGLLCLVGVAIARRR